MTASSDNLAGISKAEVSNFLAPMAPQRQVINWLIKILFYGATVLVVVPIGWIAVSVLLKGVQNFQWQMLFTLPLAVDSTTSTGFVHNQISGFAHAIVGTGLLLAICVSISLPVGLLTGIHLRSAGLASPVGLAMGILSSTPAIIAGLFIYGLLVPHIKFSALAGGCALAILCLPVIALTTAQALGQVPAGYTTASLALGVSPTATLWRLVLPCALPSMVRGIFLSLARAGGEAAPLLFTALSSLEFPRGLIGSPTPSLAVTIYRYATSPFRVQQEQTWAIALVLVLLVLGIKGLVSLGTGHGDRD
jgi:phosphate transport system permease protein